MKKYPIPPPLNKKEHILGLTLPYFFICLFLVIGTGILIPTRFNWEWRVLAAPVFLWILLAKPNEQESIFNVLRINFNYLFKQQKFYKREEDAQNEKERKNNEKWNKKNNV